MYDKKEKSMSYNVDIIINSKKIILKTHMFITDTTSLQ